MNVVFALDFGSADQGLQRVALVFGLLGYWGLFVFFPRRVGRRHVVPALIAATSGLVMGFGYSVAGGLAIPDLFLYGLVSAGIIAVALFLPVRAGWTGTSRAEVRLLGIVAVGVVAASAGTFSDLAGAARGESPALVGVLGAVYVLIPTLLWLGVTRGPHSRIARTVIVASVAIYLASLVTGPDVAWAFGQMIEALLLGYAVLRGHIEGLDLKVRFALSRSTIAAAFITVFFVASEGTQIVFGQANEWIGLFSAGALVFAIAPLQRAAERLAEKAVPVVSAPASLEGETRSVQEAAYQAAVRLALRGGITHAEELDLARIAEAHGLPQVRARELRNVIEAAWASEERS